MMDRRNEYFAFPLNELEEVQCNYKAEAQSCGLPGLPGSMWTSQKKKLDFHTRGTECACAQ